ncbi:hypothetical protein L4C33_20495, partial [Vibrio makurazakiensis]|uniref:hypothetical protein n=1 Tax=Vibrio makurazakiensis TaxID=2910250 RepID=UPI003D118E28
IDHLRPYYESSMPQEFHSYMDYVVDNSLEVIGLANYAKEKCNHDTTSLDQKISKEMVGLMFYFPQDVLKTEVNKRTEQTMQSYGLSFCSEVESKVDSLFTALNQRKAQFESGNPQ